MSQPNHEDAADIYVPGAWRCLLCGFALQTATLFARDGAVGHTRADVTRMSGESCPNDGTSMVRVTWQERANEHFAWGSQLMQEVLDATGAASLPAALAALKAPASPPPTPDVERLTCEWRNLPMTQGVLMPECCDEAFDFAVPATWAREFKFCPYCGKSLKLAGDTPTPGGEQPR